MPYLGLDLSSQSLSALVIDEKTKAIVAEHAVNFAQDLPQYKTENGFVRGENQQVFSYPALFLDAVDLLFSKMGSSLLQQIQAVSLSGQQHASVYLNDSFEAKLASLQTASSLSEQLTPTLSRSITPIWMDHSTTVECQEMAKIVGDDVIKISGSPYCERFTAAQIRKFAKQEPEAYAQTDKIHLVSSFITSVFIGRHAAIDTSDGAGMNLMDLVTGNWDKALVNACADHLAEKLPKLEAADHEAGTISSYFHQKYGFNAQCKVVNASGDNPNSLIGCGAAESGTAVISLGTSDTFFSASGSTPIDTKGIGHVFGNPAHGFMSLICFRNGSLSREEVLKYYDLDWTTAEKLISESAPAKIDQPILPYLIEEMCPPAPATTKVEDFKAWDAGTGLTALIESQFLSLQLVSQKHLPTVKLIRLTGGASRNRAIAQIIANIFQAKVECIQVTNSAGLGAAMRACFNQSESSWTELVSAFTQVSDSFEPDTSTAVVYQRKSDSLARQISQL